MEEAIYQEPAYAKNVLEFLRVAHEYCVFAERTETMERAGIYELFTKLGALLYLKGALLPEVTVDNPEANERFVTEEEWEAVFNLFRGRLAEEDEFWHIDLENGRPDETVKASLSENFADIYQDLKDFLLLYQKTSRDAKQNAVFECRKLFISRWGTKILVSIRYIHYLQFRDKFTEETELP